MIRHNTQSGFGIIEVALVTAVVAVVGFGGWAVYRHDHKTTNTNTQSTSSNTTKTSTQTTSTTPVVTADELTAVAKQVYYQTPADGSTPQSVGSCSAKGPNFTSCPFTADLITKVSNPPGVGPGNGPTLIAGSQNGPFGTVAYSATPNNQGGKVTIDLTPDASVGGGTKTWKLTMVQSDGKLLVNAIQYSRAAYSGTPACGPIEVYDYTSCPTGN
jgi:hypothetical protein